MQGDVTVTQADKQFAADWNYECKHCSEYEGDFEADLAEAVARHRLAALADAQGEPVAAQDVAALVEENKRLQQALVDHNDRLRSARSVAFRDGAETNWRTFRGAVTYTLAEHHETVVAALTALAKHERMPHDD